VAGAIVAQASDIARATNAAAGEARAERADNALSWNDWIFALSIPLQFVADAITNWHSCRPEFPVLQALLYMCNRAVDFLKLPEPWLQDLMDDACDVWGGKPPPGSLLEILTAPLAAPPAAPLAAPLAAPPAAPLATPLVEVLTMAITGADAPPQDAADAPPQDDDDGTDAPPQDDAADAADTADATAADA
jgi:hypothetical protein